MAILGFPSTSIIDSTSAGRALLTAADASAQRTLLGLGTSDSPSFLALVLSGQSLTGSSATSLIDASTTWNTTGTPTAIKLNVTDTASNAASLLLDLRVGGSSIFNFTKSGGLNLTAANHLSTYDCSNSSANGVSERYFRYGGANGDGSSVLDVAYLGGSVASPSTPVAGRYVNSLSFRTGGTNASLFSNPSFSIRHTIGAAIGSTLSEVNTAFMTNATGTGIPVAALELLGQTGHVRIPIAARFGSSGSEAYVYGDGANILALRNSTSEQTLRIYNTYTDASNYERVNLGWSGNVFNITATAAGTGGFRSIAISGYTGVTIDTQAVTVFSANGGSAVIGNGSPSLPRGVYITPLSINYVGTVVRGNVSQVEPLSIWQNSSGTWLLDIPASPTINLYNTRTDASNYERGFFRWSGNTLQIGAEKLGTGTARSLALQTDGTTRVTVSATTPTITFGTDGSPPQIFSFSGQSYTSNGNGRGLSLYTSSNSANDFGIALTGDGFTATSGSGCVHVQIARTFAPTSGTAVFNFLRVQATVNQTGGANGITRGIYINPTLTAAADYRALETDNNSGYSIYAGGTAVSYFGGNVVSIGLIQLAGTTSSFPALKRVSTTIQARLADDSGYANIRASSFFLANAENITSNGVAGDSFSFANSSGFSAVLAVDANNALSVRNSTNAQTLRVYNTYTDASNYELGKFAWSSNVLQIGTEKLGTGTARALELQTDGTTRMTFSATGLGFGVTVATSLQINTGSNKCVYINGGSSVSTGLQIQSSSRLWEIAVAGTTPSGGDFANLSAGQFGLYDGTQGLFRMTCNSSGQFGFNTFSPLAIVHTKGTSAAAGAFAFYATNSADKVLFATTNDGTLLIGNDSQRTTIFPFSSSGGLSGSLSLDGDLGVAFSSLRAASGTLPGGIVRIARANSETSTSGTTIFLSVGHTASFAPTSGTATCTMVHVWPTINQTGGANGITRGIHVNPTLTAVADFRSIETSNSTGYAFYAAGTASSYFGGSVGVGTASPSTLFEVSGANGSNIIRSTTTTNLGTTTWTGVTAHDIQFYNADPSGAGIYSAIRIIGGANSGNPNAGTADYDFTVWTGGYATALTERFRILSTGNVGIGTTSPSQKLHVAGNAYITGAFYDSTNSAGTNGQVLTSTATGTDWKSLSEITGVDGTGTANYVAKWSDADSITNSQIFDNGTNVGINTASPGYKLDVNGDTRITGYLGVNVAPSSFYDVYASGPIRSNNSYACASNSGSYSLGSSSDVVLTRDAAGVFAQRNGVNAQAFRVYNTYTDASNYEVGKFEWSSNIFQIGTQKAGTGVARALALQTDNTTRLTIDTSGNVGIGTTSPGSALDVKGTLRLSGATSGYVGFAPAAAAGSTTYTLPAADGSADQFLKTDGSGNLAWATPSAGSASDSIIYALIFG